MEDTKRLNRKSSYYDTKNSDLLGSHEKPLIFTKNE